MIGSVRPKSNGKGKAKLKPANKQGKLSSWLTGYAEARTVLAAKRAAHDVGSAGPSSKRPSASSSTSVLEQAAKRLKTIQAEAAIKLQREVEHGSALPVMKLHSVAGSSSTALAPGHFLAVTLHFVTFFV